jgi:hypothetical protein
LKVFISWSGDISRDVAKLLSEWIEDVLQGVECWYSPDDIEKGSLWFNDIGESLSSNILGILCLTADNINAPWILFEAGALYKGLTQSRVCPILIGGLVSADVRPPLSHFNLTVLSEEDMLRVLRTINQCMTNPVDDVRLVKTFKLWWPQLKTRYDAILAEAPTAASSPRKTEDILEEVLDGVRQIQRSLPATRTFNVEPSFTLRSPAVSVTQDVDANASPDFNCGIVRVDVLRDTTTATGSGKLTPAMNAIPFVSARLEKMPDGCSTELVKYSAGTGTNFDFNINIKSANYKVPLPIGEYVFSYEAKSHNN